MKKYKHLSIRERSIIECEFYDKKSSLSEIAKLLNRSKSSISRELKRNVNNNGFYSSINAEDRRIRRFSYKKSFPHLNQKYSDFTNEFKREYDPYFSGIDATINAKISNNIDKPTSRTFYNWIKREPSLITKKLRRKRKYSTRNPDPHSLSMANFVYPLAFRPKSVDKREEMGHWEADLIIGKNEKKKTHLLTFVERSTRYLMVETVFSKNQYKLIKKMNYLIRRAPLPIKTITIDNGYEFNSIGLLASWYNFKVYRCEKYASFQKGTIEKQNAELRKIFPKGTDFDEISWSEIQDAVDKINNMPRKIFNYESSLQQVWKWRKKEK